MLKYRKEKERVDGIRWLKQKREDIDRAADLRFRAIQEVETAIQQLEGNTEENLMLTETVGPEQIAEVVSLFDDENLLVRIDKSEYMEQHLVSRLICAPPGDVGQMEGGQLTEALRRRPYCVVLFDEVGKAHASVLNTLLQVLDDRRFTDGQGRTVDFRNTVIIMTSNLGAKHLLSGLSGKCSMQVARDRVMQEVRRHFRPELLNSLDEIVVFDPLSHELLRKIAMLQMKDVASCLAERGIALTVTDAALDYILAECYDPVYGARPIRKRLEWKMLTKLSKSF